MKIDEMSCNRIFKVNMRPRELHAAWSRRRPVRARFWRELKRVELEAR